MTSNIQFYFAICFPTVAIIVTILLSNSHLYTAINKRFDLVEERLVRVENKQDRMQADLNLFNHELGRHDEAIDSLKQRTA